MTVQEAPVLDEEVQMALTRSTMRVLDSWRLTIEQMQAVLGLPETVRSRSFQKFRSHMAFPDEPEVQRRADYVVRIAGALRTTYPTSVEMAGRWLRQPNRKMGHRSPLSVMIGDGEDGLVVVLADLDCTFFWSLNDGTPS